MPKFWANLVSFSLQQLSHAARSLTRLALAVAAVATCDAYTCRSGALKASAADITGADDETCCDGEWSELLCVSST